MRRRQSAVVIVPRPPSGPLRLWGSPGLKVVYAHEAAAAGVAKTLDGLADVVPLDPDAGFGPMLEDLEQRGIRRLMVEGGEQVHTQFLAEDLADELHVTIGGFFVADPDAPRFVTQRVKLPHSPDRRMHLAEASMAGETAVLRYLVRRDPVLFFWRLYRGVMAVSRPALPGCHQPPQPGSFCPGTSRKDRDK
jgi:riboflavin biosynthesis pyrimidine reductase